MKTMQANANPPIANSPAPKSEANKPSETTRRSFGERLIHNWDRMRRWPGGAWLFSRTIGFMVPYSGSIGARVETLRPGFAQISLRERRKVRNHLRSVHAIALANLGELTSGMAVLSGLPARTRGILRGINVRYEKKARGRLLATCTCQVVAPTENTEVEVHAEIHDRDQNLVAVVTALWIIGPEKTS